MKKATTCGKQALALPLLVAVAGVVMACSGGPLPVRQVYHSNNCAADADLRLLKDEKELHHLIKPKFDLGGGTPDTANVDFSRENVVLIALGQKPNAGYGIELQAEEAQIKDGAVQLPVVIRTPQPDGFYAQMMTSPCLIVALPKAKYTAVVVQDRTLTVPAG